MISRVRLLSSALLILLSTSTAHAEPRMPTHVACVGDSITAGVGASSAATNYVSLLQGLMGSAVNVANFGQSGATVLSTGFGNHPYQETPSYEAATDFVANAGAGSVTSVIILLGANDSKPQNWAPEGQARRDQQYLRDYRAMVDHFLTLAAVVAQPVQAPACPAGRVRC